MPIVLVPAKYREGELVFCCTCSGRYMLLGTILAVKLWATCPPEYIVQSLDQQDTRAYFEHEVKRA